MSPTQSELPPYEMKGSVMPVIGTRLATTAMFTHAWKQSHMVIPMASRAPVESSARSAMRTHCCNWVASRQSSLPAAGSGMAKASASFTPL